MLKMTGKGKSVFNIALKGTYIILLLGIISVLFVNRTFEPSIRNVLTQNTTYMRDFVYKYSNGATVLTDKGCSVVFLDEELNKTKFINSTHSIKINGYYSYSIDFYLMKNSYFKIDVSDPTITVVIPSSVEKVGNWYKTLESRYYYITLKKKILYANLNLQLASNIYDTTNLTHCTGTCESDKKYMVFISGNERNIQKTDTFIVNFNRDINKIFDKIIVKFLYAYIGIISFLVLIILFVILS